MLGSAGCKYDSVTWPDFEDNSPRRDTPYRFSNSQYVDPMVGRTSRFTTEDGVETINEGLDGARRYVADVDMARSKA
jgi:hypothetical protein